MAHVEFAPHLLSEPIERWAEWLFDHPATESQRKRYRFEDDCDFLDDYDFPNPEILVLEGLAELHERYAEWARTYSAAQLSQGLWVLFSNPCFLGDLLFDANVLLAPRERAMRSLVIPYRVHVAVWNPGEQMPHGWYMAWDLILKKGDRGHMDDVALECLQEILAIPNERCQAAALHGLNHLVHPDRPKVVQNWIDRYGKGWDRSWLEACCDGRAM